MATVIDRLVTEFSFRDNVSGGAAKAAKELERAAAAAQKAQSAGKGGTGAGGFLSGLKDVLSNPLGSALGDSMGAVTGAAGSLIGAVAGASAAIVGLGVAAGAGAWGLMKSAAAFDTMERTFAGAYGSIAAGKQQMKELEAYAVKSAFSLEALSSSAKTLAAGGLNVNKYLPVLERFSLVISGVDPSGLEQVAGAMLRAKGGAFGEAMEAFRRAGIGADEFRQQGIKINKGGEVQSTADEFLNAIVRVSEGKLKNMADAISGGDETKLSNVMDSVARAGRAAGAALNDRFLPKVDEVTNVFGDLVDSGTMKALADGFADTVEMLTSTGSMEDAVWDVTDRLSGMSYALETFKGGLESVWNMTVGNTPGMALIDGLSRIFTGSGIGKAIDDTYWAQGREENQSRREALELRREQEKKRNAAAGALDPEGPLTPDKKNPKLATSPALDRIAKWTQETAVNTKRQNDLTKSVLGGGELARQGLSAIELNQVRSGPRARSGRSTGSAELDQVINALVVYHHKQSGNAQRYAVDQARAGR